VSRFSKSEMAISEAQLGSLTGELVEMHESTVALAEQEIADIGADLRARQSGLHVSRRGIVISGGAGLGALLLAACGSSSKSSGGTTTTPSAAGGATSAAAGGANLSADAKAMRLNASLENLAVFAYGAAIDAVGKGTFGKVPDAISEFAVHAKAQHAAHAKSFNAALTGLGGKEYTDPDPALAKAITDIFGKAKTIVDVAKLALVLENTAGETYTKQCGELEDKTALGNVATIAPIERQHAAILSFILGEYPVPDPFVPSKLARPSSDIA
jgi:hypothetical protein